MVLHVLVEATLSPQTFLCHKEYERCVPVLIQLFDTILTAGEAHADDEKYVKSLERHAIAALEKLCKDSPPKKFPVMLLKLYEEDALSGEAIIDWWLDGDDVEKPQRKSSRDEYSSTCVTEEIKAGFQVEAEPLVIWLLQQ